ncbi:MAG: hypothetical protein K2X47_20015, partial [Bdellovibrionales bacterium]|nr:hypothetical protein [Bdellovibrionales bacterium]
MSNPAQQQPQKKGLGRGLGSLLGGSNQTAATENTETKAKAPDFLSERTPAPKAEVKEKVEKKEAAPVAAPAPESVSGVVSKVDAVLSNENLEAKVWSIPIEKIV